MLKKLIMRTVPRSVLLKLAKLRIVYKSLRPVARRTCNICNYHGWFQIMGPPARLDAMCPKCLSLERHRLLMLALDRGEIPIEVGEGDRVLHFAPEPVLEKVFRQRWASYATADLYQKADVALNLEKIDLPDRSIKVIIANHVLEHVDDVKASSELYRVLDDGGVLICMVPIVEGWQHTYENPDASTDELRWLHYGQADHVRIYGRDFRQRIARGGLELAREITAEGADVIEYGLVRGEKVFVFRKS